MIRKTLGAALFVALATAIPAAAQAQVPESAVREIARGGGFTVENSTECAPNTDVVVSYGPIDAEPRRIGASVSDANGHFSAEVALPLTAELGPGTVVVDCGIDGGVLRYDVVVVEAVESDLLEYAPYAAGGVGALLFLLLVVSRARKRSKSDEESAELDPGPPPPPVAAELAEEDEDGADYWFWDNTTERGPVKRLACLTDQDFYLHEVQADAFNPLLELLATAGPEVALQGAFFQAAVADIDEIRYRGTEMQVTYRSNGEFTTQTIDLATEVDGVIGLLSRRVPIMEAVDAIESS